MAKWLELPKHLNANAGTLIKIDSIDIIGNTIDDVFEIISNGKTILLYPKTQDTKLANIQTAIKMREELVDIVMNNKEDNIYYFKIFIR